MSEEGAVAPGKRQKLVEELAATEVSYVSSLIAAQELFLQPLLRKLGTDEEVLTAEEVSVVFGNLQELIQADKQLLFELQSRVGSWDTTSTIGDVFLSIFSDEFVLEYCTYVSHYGEAVKFLRRLRLTAKEHPALRYIAAQESKAQASAVNNLTSLLITPIQRVPRYVMILKVGPDSGWLPISVFTHACIHLTLYVAYALTVDVTVYSHSNSRFYLQRALSLSPLLSRIGFGPIAHPLSKPSHCLAPAIFCLAPFVYAHVHAYTHSLSPLLFSLCELTVAGPCSIHTSRTRGPRACHDSLREDGGNRTPHR